MHVSLRKKVRLLRELGFVYIDDGTRIFRLSETAFESLRDACRDTPREMLERYPSLLVSVRSPDEAMRRFEQAEVG